MKLMKWIRSRSSPVRTVLITLIMLFWSMFTLELCMLVIVLSESGATKRVTRQMEHFIEAHKQSDIYVIAMQYYKKNSEDYFALIKEKDSYLLTDEARALAGIQDYSIKVNLRFREKRGYITISVNNDGQGITNIDFSLIKRNGRWYIPINQITPFYPRLEEGQIDLGTIFFTADSDATTVNVPAGVRINTNSFFHSSRLLIVNLPSDTSYFSAAWFQNCDGLIAVNIASGHPSLASEDGIVYSKDKTALLYYPKGKIQNAGYNNGEFTVPSTVKTIGESAFFECHALKSITVPSSVETIEKSAFEGMRTLETIVFEEGLKRLDEDAFKECAYISSIHLPATLESIGSGAFSECSRLESVTAADGGALSSIGYSAFEKCVSLKTIALPESATEIGSWAFQDCSELRTISVLPKLKSIGLYAFRGCTKLESFFISGTVTKIEKGAFYSCKALSLSAAHPEKPAGWANDWDNGYKNTVEWGA